MITAFNALLECFVTGLVTALLIMWFAKMGWLPILFISAEDVEEDSDE